MTLGHAPCFGEDYPIADGPSFLFGLGAALGVDLAQPLQSTIERSGRTAPSSPPVTELLVAWSHGDDSALERLVPIVHEELHRLALHYMSGEHPGHTLQATALVNEVYLRLVGVQHVRWQDRAHFFAVSARLMRRILVDHARSRRSLRHGGAAQMIPLDDVAVVAEDPGENLVALDDALNALAAVDARKSQVVELRFFGGLTVEESAEALHLSPETVMRDWKLAKSWLLRELTRGRDERS